MGLCSQFCTKKGMQSSFAKNELVSDKLDEIYRKAVSNIELNVGEFPKHTRIRIQRWVKKLSLTSRNVTWQKNRNAYISLLLECMDENYFREPFHCHPPDGALPTLPGHLRLAHKRRQRTKQSSDKRAAAPANKTLLKGNDLPIQDNATVFFEGLSQDGTQNKTLLPQFQRSEWSDLNTTAMNMAPSSQHVASEFTVDSIATDHSVESSQVIPQLPQDYPSNNIISGASNTEALHQDSEEMTDFHLSMSEMNDEEHSRKYLQDLQEIIQKQGAQLEALQAQAEHLHEAQQAELRRARQLHQLETEHLWRKQQRIFEEVLPSSSFRLDPSEICIPSRSSKASPFFDSPVFNVDVQDKLSIESYLGYLNDFTSETHLLTSQCKDPHIDVLSSLKL
mmetsp:Transcript_1812/g.2471  ORF Transcript_1812/g.2471 Transcript_1812/m.2471 type:complete len:393 (-) Transcript_1812:138-1316(-)